MDAHAYDVTIVGCGPTGVVLANLLGQLGLRVAVLERESDVFPVPRATHIDEETLRNFQATGLVDALLAHTTPFGTMQVVDLDGTVLFEDRVEAPETRHGYSGSRLFDQPAFERILRGGLARYARVNFLPRVEVVRVEDQGDSVCVRARHADSGAPVTIRAAWVVGCDGGRSVVRGALGVEVESMAPKRQWVIVDTLLKDMADATLLPDGFRYMLNAERLTLYAHGVGKNRRWEFQLGPDEDVPADANVLRWLSASVDPERLEITRIASYAHTSMVAKTWRRGRVFLAGDAAHLMPPFAGQGMCSGIRDAINLAWKLHLVVTGRAEATLLDTYELERAPHVRDVLSGTLFLGRRLQGDTPFQRWRRKREMQLVMAMPAPVRRFLRRQGLRNPPLRRGFRDASSPRAGSQMPQVSVRWEGEERRLDDVLGYRLALVAQAGALERRDLEWAASRGIDVWRPGRELVEADGPLTGWMREGGIDFALVRPDRYLFAAGRASDLPRARAALDRWIRPREPR